MGLQIYRKRRDFGVTPEPPGSVARGAGGHYVIQKHDATRLHYDLRLELDGVMKSWAVTRGPSLVPGEKRLAIHVEDHPVAYSFQGTIRRANTAAGPSWSGIGPLDPVRGSAQGPIGRAT